MSAFFASNLSPPAGIADHHYPFVIETSHANRIIDSGTIGDDGYGHIFETCGGSVVDEVPEVTNAHPGELIDAWDPENKPRASKPQVASKSVYDKALIVTRDFDSANRGEHEDDDDDGNSARHSSH